MRDDDERSRPPHTLTTAGVEEEIGLAIRGLAHALEITAKAIRAACLYAANAEATDTGLTCAERQALSRAGRAR